MPVPISYHALRLRPNTVCMRCQYDDLSSFVSLSPFSVSLSLSLLSIDINIFISPQNIGASKKPGKNSIQPVHKVWILFLNQIWSLLLCLNTYLMWKVYFQEGIEHMPGTTKNWRYMQFHLLVNQYNLIDIASKVDFKKSSIMKN